MLDNDDDFLLELRGEFLQEALDLLEQNESNFLELEKSVDKAALENIFCLAHNLKGTAKAVSFDGLSNFAHEIENLLSEIRNDKVKVDAIVIDLLLECNDQLTMNVKVLQDDFDAILDNDHLVEKLKLIFNTHDQDVSVNTNSIDKNDDQTSGLEFNFPEELKSSEANELEPIECDINSAALESLKELGVDIDDSSEVIDLPMNEKKNTELIKTSPSKAPQKTKKDEFIKLSLTKIDNLLNHFGEQVILQSVLEHAKLDIVKNEDIIHKTITQLNKITYDLQQTAIALRMVPIKNVFSKMERIVRDTGNHLGKDIVFIKQGEGNELDKVIVESIIDPLTHMVRNSVDHGIESIEDRLKIGKAKTGTIELKAYPKGGFFYIELIDDGKGLDAEVIRNKAIRLGLINKHEKIEKNELFQYIFQNGFSTHEKATEISGRGVGMDVVKRSIEKLKGTIEITSEVGIGTTFLIRLPLSLAIFNGMVTRVGDENYIFSNSDIEEALRIDIHQIREIDKNNKIISIGDVVYPLIDLHYSLNKTSRTMEDNGKGRKIVFITNYEGRKYAILVDEIISQQRVVHKDLGEEAGNHPTVSGGTILGDGKVCLIMECSKIVEQYKSAS